MIAFVLASYAPDTPAGIERATAALAAGLRMRGHDTLIISAAAEAADIVRLESLRVTFPMEDPALRLAIEASSVSDEIAEILNRHRADVVVYTDALWGLGRAMADHPARKVLAVHVMGHDEDLRPALATADTVIAPSAIVLREAAQLGYKTCGWQVVPNCLLYDEAAWLDQRWRERVRAHGPIRVLARSAPEKGVAELLDHLPQLDRRVEVMLAGAPFEQPNGRNDEVLRHCLSIEAPCLTVREGGLAWRHVPTWLAGAAVVIVPSLAETFGLVALEAMNVGTPVVAYDVGNLPELIGAGGVIVKRDEGPYGLWQAAMAITQDPITYLRTSRAAYYQSRDFRPTTVADTFLKAVR
ncbi:glycosyltransferase family 4 protein [Planotetraspora sp. A-T 1434]|uniref:glycosyltransferase family 4 protein n=1 Tax=Planotetraspora sp. A-T 1434 TaxID=2979219 RepID=UPI0021BF888E|nr:glycosyltransferase family 4 protein [Planotetraspora sp. A-T 1434]MCT9934935.1 glycosyltransferase family 4 protein [Planotetraspora sp. A-T 1434]